MIRSWRQGSASCLVGGASCSPGSQASPSCSGCVSQTRTRPRASRSSTSCRSSCSRSSSAGSRACSPGSRRSRCSRSGPRSKAGTRASSPTSCAAWCSSPSASSRARWRSVCATTAVEAASAARHFELARDLLCTADFDGYLVRLNGAWEETLGWTPEELMSRPFLEFVHPDDRERTALSARGAAGGRAAAAAHQPLPAPRTAVIAGSSGPRAPTTSTSLIYAAARDVTDRREAELRPRELERAIPPLVRGLPDRHGARRRPRR